jgi:hypothetical protein
MYDPPNARANGRQVMRYSPAVVMISVLLAGCGITAVSKARSDMEQSKATYKACLAQNPNNLHACDAAQAAYDADVKAYATMTSQRPSASGGGGDDLQATQLQHDLQMQQMDNSMQRMNEFQGSLLPPPHF